MALESLAKLNELMKQHFGDAPDDSQLEIMEQVKRVEQEHDSFEKDSKAALEASDTAWRKRYAERFYGGGDAEDTPGRNGNEEEEYLKRAESLTFEDIYKTDYRRKK